MDDNNNTEEQSSPDPKLTSRVKQILAEQIGVEPEDINNEDALTEDLHMGPSDLIDFAEKLEKGGIETSGLDLTSLETVGELVEAIGSHQEIT